MKPMNLVAGLALLALAGCGGPVKYSGKCGIQSFGETRPADFSLSCDQAAAYFDGVAKVYRLAVSAARSEEDRRLFRENVRYYDETARLYKGIRWDRTTLPRLSSEFRIERAMSRLHARDRGRIVSEAVKVNEQAARQVEQKGCGGRCLAAAETYRVLADWWRGRR